MRVESEDIKKGWILMSFCISLFIYSPPLQILYKHTVAVKASPHGKLLFKSGGYNFKTGSACLCQ